MMAGLVRQHQGQPAFCERPVAYQTAIYPDVPCRSEPPRLGVDRWRFPKEFVGDFRKCSAEFLQQVQHHPSTLLLRAPARKHLLRGPIQEAHLANICALPSGNLAECYRVHLGSASLELGGRSRSLSQAACCPSSAIAAGMVRRGDASLMQVIGANLYKRHRIDPRNEL